MSFREKSVSTDWRLKGKKLMKANTLILFPGLRVCNERKGLLVYKASILPSTTYNSFP